MSDTPQCLVHICSAADWARASAVGEHRPASLAEVGFVHLSTHEQVHLPANRLYAGRTDLVLLHLMPELLGTPVRWELETGPSGHGPGSLLRAQPITQQWSCEIRARWA